MTSATAITTGILFSRGTGSCTATSTAQTQTPMQPEPGIGRSHRSMG